MKISVFPIFAIRCTESFASERVFLAYSEPAIFVIVAAGEIGELGAQSSGELPVFLTLSRFLPVWWVGVARRVRGGFAGHF